MSGVFTDAHRHCVITTRVERKFTHFVHNDGSAIVLDKLQHEIFNQRYLELVGYDPKRAAKIYFKSTLYVPITPRAKVALNAILDGADEPVSTPQEEPEMATKKKSAAKKTAAPAAKAAPKKTPAAAKSPTPKPVPAKAPAEKKSEGRGRRSEYAGKIIKNVVKENPKREGTLAHKIFSLYKAGMKVEDFFKAGGNSAALRYDIENDYVTLG